MSVVHLESISCAVRKLGEQEGKIEEVTCEHCIETWHMCATCGESTVRFDVAEVVRDGNHVLVHADACMEPGEEVA